MPALVLALALALTSLILAIMHYWPVADYVLWFAIFVVLFTGAKWQWPWPR